MDLDPRDLLKTIQTSSGSKKARTTVSIDEDLLKNVKKLVGDGGFSEAVERLLRWFYESNARPKAEADRLDALVSKFRRLASSDPDAAEVALQFLEKPKTRPSRREGA